MPVLAAKIRLVLASMLGRAAGRSRAGRAIREGDNTLGRLHAVVHQCLRISNTVVASRIRGYKKNAHYLIPPWQYLDIETALQKSPRP